jgi:hypothetical protein
MFILCLCSVPQFKPAEERFLWFSKDINNDTAGGMPDATLVTQVAEAEVEVVTAPSQNKYTYASLPGDNLNDFLTRPRQIYAKEWTIGSEINEGIQPWKLFMNNSYVKDKLKGYSRFRGELELTIMVNGSAFHRGAIIFSYIPLANERLKINESDGTVADGAGLLMNDGVVPPRHVGIGMGMPNGAAYHAYVQSDGLFESGTGQKRWVPLSQRLNFVSYPSESTSGHMTLPFIFPTEYLKIDNRWFTNRWWGDGSTATDLGVNPLLMMGSLDICSLMTLGALGSNVSDGVDIIILANLKPGYELVGPTRYTLQGGEGPMAPSVHAPKKASQSGLWRDVVAGVGSIAARYAGMSQPPLMTDVDSVRLQNVANLANTQLSTRDEVLANDPMTSLVTTPARLGGDPDDMNISHLLSKKSVLSTFAWSATGASSLTGYTIFKAYNCPMLDPTKVYGSGLAGTTSRYIKHYPTPLSYLSKGFSYWRGSLIYTIKVVTTKFQKGRLLITFDPNGVTGGTEGEIDETVLIGTSLAKVIDISETTEYEFEVPYMATTAWLRTSANVADESRYMTPEAIDDTPGGMYYEDTMHNGSLNVSILNTLTNDLDAYVMVSVRAGKDFEFSAPCGISKQVTLQDAYITQGDEVEACHTDYVGEKIVSLGDMMHRSSVICRLKAASAGDVAISVVGVEGVPRGGGLVTSDLIGFTRGGAYKYIVGTCPHSYEQWFKSMFAAARGSHRLTIGGIYKKPYGTATSDNIPSNGGPMATPSSIESPISVSIVRSGQDFLPLRNSVNGTTRTALNVPKLPIYHTWILYGTINPLDQMDTYVSKTTGTSELSHDGGSVVVPYQSNTLFRPTNIYYDALRPNEHFIPKGDLFADFDYRDGLAIPAPWDYGAAAADRVSLLSDYFPPQDKVMVQGGIDAFSSRDVFSATGSDYVLAHFVNAPPFWVVCANDYINTKIKLTTETVGTTTLSRGWSFLAA